MEFSEALRCGLAAVSPDGCYLAATVGVRLVVYSVSEQQQVAAFVCLDDPQSVQWSPDSSLLLSAVFSRRAVQLWSLADPDWRCRIDEADIGLAAARWSPDSRHVLTTAELTLRVTVWSLVDRSVCYIKYVKDIPSSLTFSPDGEFLAVVERRGCTDHISVFSCRAWHLVKHLDEVGQDVAGLAWSPDSELFCVWDGWQQFRLAVYDVAGRQLAELRLSDVPLGVSTVSWSPSGQLLAVAGYDDKVHLVSHVTWRRLTSLRHVTAVVSDRVHVYREQEARLTGFKRDLALAAGADTVADVTYELLETRPVALRQSRSAADGHRLKQGVTRLLFSPDNRFLACRYDGTPDCVWIWSMANLSLHTVLVHKATVKDLVWEPTGVRLALCTGSRYLYLWDTDQCCTCRSPTDVHISQLLWPDESTVLLQGKDCVLFCRLDAAQSQFEAADSPPADSEWDRLTEQA